MRGLKILWLMMMGLLMPLPALADDSAVDDYDIGMANLLQILEVETDLATKSKMNADFVPGMVTVLHGDELEALGIDTVWHAMEMVPGMMIRRSQSGDLQVVTRGLGGAVASPEIKFLVDGIPAHTALLGFGSVLFIPIPMVERIEVVRGPGSALYGGYAFAGVVNVLTRKSETRGMIEYGSNNTSQLQAVYAHDFADDDMRFSINVGQYKTDGANMLAGPDQLGNSGQVKDYTQEEMMVLNVGYKHTDFYARINQTTAGNHLGLQGVIEPVSTQKPFGSTDYLLGISQRFDFSEDVSISLKADYANYRLDGTYAFAIPFLGVVIAQPHYREEKTSESALLNVGLSKHSLLLGVEGEQAKPTEISNVTKTASGILIPAPLWIKEGNKRNSEGYFIQDEMALMEDLTLTLAIRHDSFSDVGQSTNPRVAMVYHLNDSNIFKAQYASAFRPPTLYELYENTGTGNEALLPETIESYELGYIYQHTDTVFRLTLFDAIADNMIIHPINGSFVNLSNQVHSQGVELELEQVLANALKMSVNLSYTDAKDVVTGDPLEATADVLANAMVIWQPMHGYSVSSWLRYVGPRHRSSTDTRNDLPSDTTLDLAVTAHDFSLKGLKLQAGIQNVFNHAVTFPSPENTFVNDFPVSERTFWSRVAYEF